MYELALLVLGPAVLGGYDKNGSKEGLAGISATAAAGARTGLEVDA